MPWRSCSRGPHVEQPIDRGNGAHGVERREHHVAGDGGAQADLDRFLVGISPTRMMSGSWRSVVRRTRPKSRPIFALICHLAHALEPYSTISRPET